VKAGSGALTHSVPDSKGIPEDVTKNTILVPFNDLDAIETALSENQDEVAAMITEPIMGNAGFIPPREGYLQDAKGMLEEHGSLMILDEVITGFRLGLGGAQEHFSVDADIITMGKIVGGGFPIGVIGARHEIMDRMTPGGDIYNAGTFNGNPVSIAAGLATLRTIKEENVLDTVARTGADIQRGITDIVEDLGLGFQVQGLGPMFQVYFNDEPVWNLADAKASRSDVFLNYCAELRAMGVFLPPSQFECCFVSLAHDRDTIDFTLEQFKDAMGKVTKESGP
jgi:glutamate-1-semialdehyde 2,1-aminomutase